MVASSPPAWLSGWCQAHLGGGIERELFEAGQMAEVFGVRLDDGRAVVVKARASEGGRAAACVEVQKSVAAAGIPCAAPLTDAVQEGGVTIHAEEWRPGGGVRTDDGPEHAAEAAHVLATLLRVTTTLEVQARRLLPNPVWIDWNQAAHVAWPRHDAIDAQQARTGRTLPDWLEEVQRRLLERLRATSLPLVAGHGDWEAQNLRWTEDGTIHTIHDWDSLAALPEAALVGAAAGAFASTDIPTLAPLASSETFIAAYEASAGRRLGADELEVAWAASMYPAAHNARGEVLFGSPPVATVALRDQAGERLRRAGA